MTRIRIVTREEAYQDLEPHFPEIRASYDDAFRVLQHFPSDYPETGPIATAGVRRDQVVRFMRENFAAKVASGEVRWKQLEGSLPILEIVDSALAMRFNRLDQGHNIATNDTQQSKEAYTQHLLGCIVQPKSGSATANTKTRRALVVAGGLWDRDMVIPPRVLVVCRAYGEKMWSIEVPPAQPGSQSIAPATNWPNTPMPRSTKKKDDEEKKEPGA